MITQETLDYMASLFWKEARLRVLDVAKYNNFSIDIPENDVDFLFDLYDGGDHIPTDEEIIEAIEEYLNPPMNILEYIEHLIARGYTEDEAEKLAAYEYSDYHEED